MIDEQVDVAVHPPFHHPDDPYARGRLITRRVGDVVELVEHDDHILLDCGFLWDIVANQHAFAPFCQLLPPERRMAMTGNFNIAPAQTILALNIPSNRPDMANSYAMCQHWSLLLTVGSRCIEYRIGSYRPSINAMEASWHA